MKKKFYPNCLIFSTFDDVYIRPVMEKMPPSAIPFICDYTRFGIDYTATITTDQNIILSMFDDTDVCFSEVRSIWWRRPGNFPHHMLSELPIAKYIYRDMTQFWESVVAILECNPLIRWYNPIYPQMAASRKAFQKLKAKEAGLTVTEGITTSSKQYVEKFVSSDDPTIFKMSTTWMGDTVYWQPTRLWQKDMLQYLDTLHLCPVIFQRYLAGNYDYRVTVIDNMIQAARYDLRTSEYPFDVRVDVRTKVEACKLDSSLEHKIFTLMQLLNLRYGALDFREDKNGELIFLEINPAGGFRHIDQMAGTDITTMMATALSDNIPVFTMPAAARQEENVACLTEPCLFEYSTEQRPFAERLGKPIGVIN